MIYEYYIGGVAGLALLYAWQRARAISAKTIEDEKARGIAEAIRDGAMAFLSREYRVLALVIAIIAVLMWMTRIFGSTEAAIAPQTIVSFLVGALLSVVAGNIGMRIATLANVRRTEACR